MKQFPKLIIVQHRATTLLLEGLKNSLIFLLSSQGALGKGSEKQVSLGPQADKQGLNYLGNSVETRLLFGALKKRLYDTDESVFKNFLRAHCDDAAILQKDGFSYHGDTWHLGFLGSLGDWPWHVKGANLNRSFLNVQKQASAVIDHEEPPEPPEPPATKRRKKKKKCNVGGICHLCPAGQCGYPWEDMQTTARWVQEIGLSEPPWAAPSCLVSLFLRKRAPEMAFKFDCWHGWHLGACKEFCGSALVEILPVLDAEISIEKQIILLNQQLKMYLTETAQEERLTFVNFTKDRLSWTSFNKFPKGVWQKATDSVIMLRFTVWIYERNANKLNDTHALILDAARSMDKAFSLMYEHGTWITAPACTVIGRYGLRFLQQHSIISKRYNDMKLNRFYLQPKFHLLAHTFIEILWQSELFNKAFNPLVTAVPQNEDFVGKLSRSSRRVSQRLVSLRTAQAYLIQLAGCWQKPFIFGVV